MRSDSGGEEARFNGPRVGSGWGRVCSQLGHLTKARFPPPLHRARTDLALLRSEQASLIFSVPVSVA